MTGPIWYRDPTGKKFQESAPPLNLEGITMRIFPVQANLATLVEFCGRYLNIVPREVAWYRPASPFVNIQLINYGRMSPLIKNVGWVAQNEIGFTVPLEWYREIDGRLVFQDWASFSPFIFVDSEISEIGGREVYGWPKEFAELTPQIPSWAHDPEARSDLLSVDTRSWSTTSAKGWEPARLLEVLQNPLPGSRVIPPQWANPFNPVFAASTAARGSGLTWSTLSELLAASPLRGYPPLTPPQFAEMTSRVLGRLSTLLLAPIAPRGAVKRALEFNTVNLKQFRVTGQPEMACYQALVNAKMELRRLNRGGFLGEPFLLRGDPTGGFELKLSRRTGGNIIAVLGLETEGALTISGQANLKMRPLLPYWVDVDTIYGRGNALAWRVLGDPKRPEESKPPEPLEDRTRSEGRRLFWLTRSKDGTVRKLPPRRGYEKGTYRDAREVPWEAIVGPIEARDASVRVLPLPVEHPGKLKIFCDEYLNGALETFETKTSFEPWGDHVLCFATSFGQIVDGYGGVSSWAHREVAFGVPVVWLRGEPSKRDVIRRGLVFPFMFADSDIETLLSRERVGFPMFRADMSTPPTNWVEGFRPDAQPMPLLTLKSELLAAPYPGEKVENLTLLEIAAISQIGSTAAVSRSESPPPDSAGSTPTERLAPLIGHGSARINRFTLRQYPDCYDTRQACYQALISAPVFVGAKAQIEPFAPHSGIALKIYKYPSFPIVDRLGLKVEEPTRATKDRIVEVVRPEHAFWMKSDLTFKSAYGIIWRGEDVPWQGRIPKSVPAPDIDTDQVTPIDLIKALLGQPDRS